MRKFLLALVLAIISYSAFSAEPLDCRGLKVATGPHGKGYSKLFDNIKDVTNGQIPMCEIASTGGLDNLNKLAMNQADIGIVPIDALKEMAAGSDSIASLQAIMPLNTNFLHIITNSNGFTIAGEKKWGLLKGDDTTVVISKFSDLKGRRVALVGTASLWVRKLNQQLGYGMQFIDVDSDAQAFDMVKKGQVFAMFSVSGWPSGPVGSLKMTSGLTLVPYDGPATSPYVVKNLNYSNIGVYNSATLGVQNILVTRPFHGQKVTDVANLKNAIAKHLVDLQDGSYEPGWKEIQSVDSSIEWKKFNPK
jgi:TRAP-type uncharacterized transport system substrate-binding protein